MGSDPAGTLNLEQSLGFTKRLCLEGAVTTYVSCMCTFLLHSRSSTLTQELLRVAVETEEREEVEEFLCECTAAL